jgi:hypothetical protein
MNRKGNPADLSYFRLSLLAFLKESHPQLLHDEKSITARADAALTAYEQAVRNGDNPLEAGEQANKALFEGLYFSKHDTLKNILWNEFPKEIPEAATPLLAIRLLPECESVCLNHDLSD